jgi:hypothetical protein
MKLSIYTLLLALGLTGLNVKAEENYCESPLFNYLQKFEKVSLALPKREPQGDLAALAETYEILCPWNIEEDLNGDRKKDWAGIVYRDHKYQLVAYLSQKVSFKTEVLETYKAFPKDTFIEVIRFKDIQSLTKKTNLISSAKYGIIVKQINKTNSIYLAAQDKVTMVHNYPNDTVVVELKEDEYEDEESTIEDEENID